MAISYIGGKSTISKWIIPFIPKNIETYVEPFSGMFWVFFKMDLDKFPNLKTVVYNDFNSLNANLFRCIKDYDRLHEECSKYPYQNLGEDIDPKEYIEIFNKCQKEIFDPNFITPIEADFEIAGKYLYVLCHIFSGGKPGKSKYIYYHGKYLDKGIVFLNKLKNTKWRKHFDKITFIECADACDVIKKYDSENTYFYCDPPYFGCSDYYSNQPFTDKDHERFINCLKSIKGNYSLSYYEFPELHEWLPKDRYRWESKEFHKSAAASKGKKQTKGTELLIMNYDLNDNKDIDHKELITKWEKLGLLDGLTSTTKNGIAEQLECCGENKMEKSDSDYIEIALPPINDIDDNGNYIGTDPQFINKDG